MTRNIVRSIALSTLSLTSLALASPLLAAGPGGGGGGGGGGPGQGGMSTMPQGSGDLDRLRDRDRVDTPDQDRDRLKDQDKDKDQDRDRLRDPDQDRDRLRDPDQDRDRLRDQDYIRDRDRLHVNQVVDGQISSWQLLTDSERQQFHSQMRAAATQQDRDRIRAEHQEMIQERARDLGVDAPFGPDRSGYGSSQRSGYILAQMLTEQERLQFFQRMRAASSAEERLRIRTEMETTARQRAQEMGIDIPAWYGASGQGQ